MESRGDGPSLSWKRGVSSHRPAQRLDLLKGLPRPGGCRNPGLERVTAVLVAGCRGPFVATAATRRALYPLSLSVGVASRPAAPLASSCVRAGSSPHSRGPVPRAAERGPEAGRKRYERSTQGLLSFASVLKVRRKTLGLSVGAQPAKTLAQINMADR